MLELRDFTIQFGRKHVVSGNFIAYPGHLTCLTGESGSGKTSLLNILSLYYYDQDFDYIVNDINLKNVSKEELSYFKKQHISFLPQHPLFLETMTCLENVQLECEIAGVEKTKEEILQVLDELQLKDKINQYPKKLSGGEKQRLMIASAILKNADIILCDEITSSLDTTNTQKILEIFIDLAQNKNKMVIIASHEDFIIDNCDVVYEIQNKKLTQTKSDKVEGKVLLPMKKNTTKNKYLLKIALSRLKKKKIVFTLLLIVASITTASLSFATTWILQNKNFIQTHLEGAYTNEIVVLSQTWAFPYNFYNHGEPPINSETIESISKLDKIKTIYPFYGYSCFEDTVVKNDVEWTLNGETIGSFTLKPDQDWRVNPSFVPYYEEQNFYENSEITTNTLDGVYIHESVADLLGIEVQDNMTITFEFFVPVAIEKYKNQVWYKIGNDPEIDYKIMEDTVDLTYSEPIKITLPISGIIPIPYETLGKGGTPFFIPYSVFEYHYEQAIQDYELLDGQEPFAPSAYKIFLNSAQDRTKTIRQIEELDVDIGVIGNFEDYITLEKTLKSQRTFFSTSTLIIYGISVILMLIYGFFHRKDILEQDDVYFNTHGILQKEKKLITYIESSIITLIIFLFSLPILYYLVQFGIGEFLLFSQEIAPFSYSMIILRSIVFSLILTFACESPLLFAKEI